MRRSDERILTTHVGSLPRPPALRDLLVRHDHGESIDQDALQREAESAVRHVVARQLQAGIDVVNDGEQSKAGFFAYVRERLGGFEPTGGEPPGRGMQWVKEISTFPEYYVLGGRALLGLDPGPKLS